MKKKAASRPLLLVRVDHEPDAPIRWHLHGDAQPAQQGVLDDTPPPADRMAEAEVILLLPASRILFYSAALPGQRRRASLQPLLWQLEEQALSPAEALHAVLLANEGDLFSLVAVEKILLNAWLVRLRQLGIAPVKALPDVLALPLMDAAASALLLDNEWLVRLSPRHGFSTPADQLMTVWPRLETPDKVCATGAPLPALPGWQCQVGEASLAWLAQGARQSPINLLSGEFARRPTARFRWRPLLLLLTIWLLTLAAAPLLDGYRQQRQAARLQQQLRQQVHQLMPTLKDPQPLKALTRQLSQLAAAHPVPDLLALLTDAQPWLNTLPAAAVSRMRWNAGTQTLQLELNQSADALRPQLAFTPPATLQLSLQSLGPQHAQLTLQRKPE